MATRTASTPQPVFTPQEDVERDTLCKIFYHAIDRFGRPNAMRYKEGGVWRDISHAEAEQRVARLAAALEEMGVERGDRVALLSENRPEWALTDYAALGLGAVTVPIYATLPAAQVAFILADCGARVVAVSTQEQLAKILEIREEVPALEQVIAFDDPRRAADVRSFGEVLEAGQRAIAEGRASDLRERALSIGRDDLATLIYTSGTTGDPKGVMLTHYNIASNVAATHQHRVVLLNPGDVGLSFLPLSHSFERTVDYFYWYSGACIAYAESIEKLGENMIEVSPDFLAAAPRVFEKIYTKVMGATGLKQKIVAWAKGVGEATVENRLAGREPSGLSYKLADRLVFSKLRERTGGKVRGFISGSAPLSADIARFFWAAGLPVYEGYGLTETSPVLSANRPGDVKLGSVGLPFPGVEIRIAENGEIVARGPNIMKGYWNAPEATAEVIDEEGWFHTGDVGEFDEEGFLRITDRIKNLIVTAGGKNIAPAPIEGQAAMSPFVSQVVMLGDRRAFPSLLVVPDFENLGAWAQEKGIDASDRQRLVQDPRVHELMEQETLGRLAGLARYEMPKKITVVGEDFTIESGMLTPTLKVKRKVVEERFRDQIEGIYQNT
ncbi:MAG: AMP-dependent synthetase/ligase [Longimicrobiaceae bacterium]